MPMRTVRAVLSTLVAAVIALKFVLGDASPPAVFAFLLLTGVLVAFPAMMIDGDTRLDRPEATAFVVTAAFASCWLLTLDGGDSPVPWLAFGLAWITGLASYTVAVRVKHRNGTVVCTDVLEALAGWPAMRQFNTSVTAPAAALDLRPTDLRGAQSQSDREHSGPQRPALQDGPGLPGPAVVGSVSAGQVRVAGAARGYGMTRHPQRADPSTLAGSARRRLREQGRVPGRPVGRPGLPVSREVPRSAG